ncbi:rhomboid family intramembrane serine protease [Halopiger goleimassiliensis]|uniref:rhomboid family intramembrane serine protease n=1 Tax=Halopiger goleimassiliensis TaxID=1293048 RepID=UPI00067762AE|nr:rhomboid family intramembrane serine protease [Halopiger goleimassiliensis]
MPVSPSQIGLGIVVVAVLGFVWYVTDRDRWRTRLEERFVYGLPVGTLLTVAVVVGVYLFVQGGLFHWSDPVTVPYVSWSYFYPTGLFASGLAHGSPSHLVSNMLATLAFGAVAEYAWGHYPPGADSSEGLLSRPLVRALVVVPVALVALAVATAVFAMGPGLGFSGAVYGIVGFAVVMAPLWTVVGVVTASGLSVVYDGLAQPVLYASTDPGPPGPPGWAGVGFQAHLLGFLIGVVVAITVLRVRTDSRSFERVFAATLLVGLVQSLWLLVWSTGDTFVRYQSAGVAFVFLLSLVIASAVAGSLQPLLGRFASVAGRPIRRLASLGWLALLVGTVLLGLAASVLAALPLVPMAIGLVVVAALLAIPALPAALRDPDAIGPLSRRGAAVSALLVLTVLVAFPSVPANMLVVDDAGLEGQVEATVDVEGYTVAYGENVTNPRIPAFDPGIDDVDEELTTNRSGLFVADAERELWTVSASDDLLAYHGDEQVELGGPGWYEVVTANRTGWDVVGNDTAYAVDLEHDGETVRSFTADPVRASVVIDGHELEVVPTADDFRLEVRRNGTTVGAEPIPAANESVPIGDLVVTTDGADDSDEADRLSVATADGATEAEIAVEEAYAGD